MVVTLAGLHRGNKLPTANRNNVALRHGACMHERRPPRCHPSPDGS